jgi:tetratricopeptide (TPR) repeat protein
MGLHGDLSTLDLTSLLQNLEGARKTGLLTVRDDGEETYLHFEQGQLALIAYSGRASLVDYLLASGTVEAPALEKAKKSKRRGQGVCAALVDAGALSAEELTAIVKARLVDDACEVLGAGARKFEFAEVEGPTDAFDPDERALSIALAASPLLLESARRSDHWTMIREQVPSDSAHFTVSRPPRTPGDEKKAEFQSEVLGLLDGARSVRDVVGQFPTRRFEAYQLLADLAQSQTIRPIPIADLNTRILELARRDRARALALLERSLEQNPHHVALLGTKAMLAEKMGDRAQAVEALKLVAHLQLESGEEEPARATLARLKRLDESDPYAWEKSFELALSENRAKDALADGQALIEIYRKPGLSRKVVEVLERLDRIQGSKWEHVRELARARAAAGDRDAAAKGLEKFAAGLIGLESYPLACKAYEELLAIHPTRRKAKETLEDLRSGALVQRKARWRRLRLRALAGLVGFVVLPWLGYEVLARRAYVETTREVLRERLLEAGRYETARARYAALLGRYGWSTTGCCVVEPVIAELDLMIAAPIPAAEGSAPGEQTSGEPLSGK